MQECCCTVILCCFYWSAECREELYKQIHVHKSSRNTVLVSAVVHSLASLISLLSLTLAHAGLYCVTNFLIVCVPLLPVQKQYEPWNEQQRFFAAKLQNEQCFCSTNRLLVLSWICDTCSLLKELASDSANGQTDIHFVCCCCIKVQFMFCICRQVSYQVGSFFV